MRVFFNLRILSDYGKGLLMSGVVLFLALGIMCAVGVYTFSGRGDFSGKWFVLYFAAFLIQATGEEIMCRGFLMTSLNKKFSRAMSVLVSSLAFIAPHLFSLPEGLSGIISILNLMLVSVLFSLLFYRYDTIGVCSGFHAGWNFIVSYLCGLQLSGKSMSTAIINLTAISKNSILTGGEYGIEASGVVTLLLCALLFLIKRVFRYPNS